MGCLFFLFLMVFSTLASDEGCSSGLKHTSKNKCQLSKADMVQRLGDTWSRVRHQDDLDEFIRPDMMNYQSLVGKIEGLAGFKQFQNMWYKVLDPLTCMIQYIGEGPEVNQATAQWRCRGKFVGNFPNLKGTTGVTVVDFSEIHPHNEYLYTSGFYTLTVDEDGWLKRLDTTWDTGIILDILRDPAAARASDPLNKKES